MPPISRHPAPVYVAVRERIADMIIDGAIEPGAHLPSVRSVAAEQRVNPMTVHKGYQSLVELGVIEPDAGRGMLVLPMARELLLQIERDNFLENEWPEVTRTIRRLGLDVDELLSQSEEHAEDTQ